MKYSPVISSSLRGLKEQSSGNGEGEGPAAAPSRPGIDSDMLKPLAFPVVQQLQGARLVQGFGLTGDRPDVFFKEVKGLGLVREDDGELDRLAVLGHRGHPQVSSLWINEDPDRPA